MSFKPIPYALRRSFAANAAVQQKNTTAQAQKHPVKPSKHRLDSNVVSKITPLALPISILLICFTLPPETSVSLGPIRLSPYRLCLIFFFIPAFKMVLSARHNGFCFPDFLILSHGIWAVLALSINMGVSTGIESGGIYFIETVGAYFLARAYVQNVKDYESVIDFTFKITAVLLVFAVVESFSGQHFIRNIFKAILGGSGPHYIEPRLGLTRAFTSFEHPILFGVFSASAFAGTYYVIANAKLCMKTAKKLAVIVGATFFSLSGGPYTALALQIGFIAWDKVTTGIQNRWMLLTGLFMSAWFVMTMASNRSPILVFISYLTFSAQSAYNRVHIWNYGTAEVGRHPLFGIGLNDWIRAPWMSSSMDNFWLLTTVRYGIPAFLFMLIAIIIIITKIHPRKVPNGLTKNARKAFVVMLIGFGMSGLTVHFWNALMVQFFFFIGCGLSLLNPPKQER